MCSTRFFFSPITRLYLPSISSKHLSKNLPTLSINPISIAMAGEPKSYAAVVAADDVDAKYGFERTEMYQTNLAGTVDYFERHVFLCYKSHDSWPSKVEDSDSDPLPKKFASALKARRSDNKIKVSLTNTLIFSSFFPLEFDILIFVGCSVT